MTAKSFIYGLLVTFAFPWMLLLAVPSYRMSQNEPPEYVEAIDGKSGVFVPKRAGNLQTGLDIYMGNGCATCHSQLIRTTDAGSDMWREDWGGIIDSTGDSRRETRWWDYQGERVAPVGFMRIGPDLSNVASRVTARYLEEAEQTVSKEFDGDRQSAINALARGRAEEWLFLHLYNPRNEALGDEAKDSRCDAHRDLFEEVQIGAAPLSSALPIPARTGYQMVPKEKAKRLVSYLMTLHRDDKLPQGASYKPKATAGNDAN